ncbi:hypothetical protein BKP37_07915 [Anaerobacillus alkalilacustris]|uniref:Uncharacterized protein n=1 Tax=Anaerobacillus alkalilacustris TaxID=393763 RepID=A0A1S2LR51_9BACI|nr:hypothetical protein [Anaerobacillus alkalilacustris]OIJ14680.1 hypothetical protein BKP37_07915 [Anaerobacillus alkalilacustris]
MKKQLMMIPFLFIILSVVVGCSGNKQEDHFQIYIFSELNDSFDGRVSTVLEEVIEDVIPRDEFELYLFPKVIEKIVIEIVSKGGDIFILEEDIVMAALDPVGVYPLDELMGISNVELVQEYMFFNEETGEMSVYAVPLTSESVLFKDIVNQLPNRFVALIPHYSDEKERAIELLAHFLND